MNDDHNILDVIWNIAKTLKGWDGSPENAGDKLIEAAKHLRAYGYWQGKLPVATTDVQAKVATLTVQVKAMREALEKIAWHDERLVMADGYFASVARIALASLPKEEKS